MKALLILIVVLAGCDVETDTEKFDRFMTELECPVILIGKTDKAVNNPSIIVRDAKGRIRTMGGRENYASTKYLAAAIADSREVGDTLKPCQ